MKTLKRPWTSSAASSDVSNSTHVVPRIMTSQMDHIVAQYKLLLNLTTQFTTRDSPPIRRAATPRDCDTSDATEVRATSLPPLAQASPSTPTARRPCRTHVSLMTRGARLHTHSIW
ncbi:hypothetical protein J6590_073066 [Homalodisca vitripennis]|nr:hypothetical protein J6590_073066 [Homalodisca vitripennis]